MYGVEQINFNQKKENSHSNNTKSNLTSTSVASINDSQPKQNSSSRHYININRKKKTRKSHRQMTKRQNQKNNTLSSELFSNQVALTANEVGQVESEEKFMLGLMLPPPSYAEVVIF